MKFWDGVKLAAKECVAATVSYFAGEVADRVVKDTGWKGMLAKAGAYFVGWAGGEKVGDLIVDEVCEVGELGHNLIEYRRLKKELEQLEAEEKEDEVNAE